MPTLFIANTTKQHHDFLYRPKLSDGGLKDGVLRPTFGDLRKHHIPLGSQICLRDLSQAEITVILDQHKHIVDFQSLNRVKGFNGLCYRQGQEVPMDEILERIETNDAVRTEESKDRQAASARQIAANLRSVSQEGGVPFQDLRETDVQVAQKGATEVNGGTPKLNQVVEVMEAGKEPSKRGRQSAA